MAVWLLAALLALLALVEVATVIGTRKEVVPVVAADRI